MHAWINEDYAWVRRESVSAWLDGRDDGRAALYERFYRAAYRENPDAFDLEATNERYAEVCRQIQFQPWRKLGRFNQAWLEKLVVMLIGIFLVGRLAPVLVHASPALGAGGAIALFVGLRILRRRAKA